MRVQTFQYSGSAGDTYHMYIQYMFVLVLIDLDDQYIKMINGYNLILDSIQSEPS